MDRPSNFWGTLGKVASPQGDEREKETKTSRVEKNNQVLFTSRKMRTKHRDSHCRLGRRGSSVFERGWKREEGT